MREINFEEALAKMSTIVNKLEKENVPLQESIDLYKEGMGLYKICKEKLDEASTQITKLIENDGDVIEEHINAEELAKKQ